MEFSHKKEVIIMDASRKRFFKGGGDRHIRKQPVHREILDVGETMDNRGRGLLGEMG